MTNSSSYFVAGKFGAAQGVRGGVRVISLMNNPADILDADCWYIETKSLIQAIPSAKPNPSVVGVDADQHFKGGRTQVAAVDRADKSSSIHLTTISLEKWQHNPKGYAVTLPGLNDRNQAQLLTHQLIYLPIEVLNTQEVDDLYWRDLIGLTVHDGEGQPQGIVSEMLETGANDVMVVSGGEHGRTLVPYIPDQVIQSVDLESKVIILDWDFNDDE